ncbi:proteinaceous RNase P 1, chloroplastic/mitochondrial-like [Impatiens glandulifera]|uniref:proteinaceous RNase P 1, chloroplastic/mitochondrial-like n=1 Tax=Impatiens glandulifera TaxID=253017 RepID=UPI001FB18A22|nr:proteinaceous RNase P 1, chloroplastic/mitochondrial-like [Impatiens glandulifera]
MLLRRGFILLSSFARAPSLLAHYSTGYSRRRRPVFGYPLPIHARRRVFLSINQMGRRLSTETAALVQEQPYSKKKSRRQTPEGILRHKFDMCSKNGDVDEALRLYDDAKKNGIPLVQHHYNILLYLCSSVSNGSFNPGLERGFEIFKQMRADNIDPNEATFTNLARLSAAKEDPEMAFDSVKQMKNCGIPPKLRSYGPALFGFCGKGMADKAYEVDADMVESGVLAEESELSALLKVSAESKRELKVYETLHRLRASVRQVTEETCVIIEEWFKSDKAKEVGEANWDVNKVKEGIVKGGGGWHGQGWLGSGEWKVVRTHMNESGVCQSCTEKLVSIDIDPKETQQFADSLANLACQRETRADFLRFQEWLQRYGPFDAVVDGANVGLINEQEFNFYQLNTVVDRLRRMSPSKKLPLVILHQNRVNGGPARNPQNKKLLDTWRKSGVLYATPHGSNDDWYWLYAAVSCKGLLVTNDEMRDHLFQLLGTSFFPRWKEKHQVRLVVSKRGLNFHMPPPYSLVIQESGQGNWHVPTMDGDDIERPRQWVCIGRQSSSLQHHLVEKR